MKKIIHVDMDDVLCDYKGGFVKAIERSPYNQYPQSVYGFYTSLAPIPGAVEAIKYLQSKYEVYIATRPSYMNPLCYTEKRVWIEKHLGLEICKNLAMTPNKNLLIGDYLIDDMPWFGFKGKQILFGSDEFPDWESVITKNNF
jgi:5'-nucleotidase